MIQENIFKTSISFATRIQAEQFRRRQFHPDKRIQVYLNTLAISSVKSYLNSWGWNVDLATGDSWNPVLQTMLDVADIDLPNYGKIECRVVLPDEKYVKIPPEVWCNRIAYIVVELNEFLTEARILGFVREATQIKVPLDSLESLTDLAEYLARFECNSTPQLTHLSNWLSGNIENNWLQPKPEILPSTKINYRTVSDCNFALTASEAENLSRGECRSKILELGKSCDRQINLVLNIEPKAEREFSISLKVCPTNSQIYLPQGLELVVFDEAKKPVMCAQANDTETIEFCFSGELGEHFGIEASLNDLIKTETFII